MIPTPWSLASESSGEFAQANLVREKPGPPSNWVGDFRFPSQLDAGAGTRNRRSRPTKRTHRDPPGLEHFSVVTLPFAFLGFPCALAAFCRRFGACYSLAWLPTACAPSTSSGQAFTAGDSCRRRILKRQVCGNAILKLVLGCVKKRRRQGGERRKGELLFKKPEDRRNRFPVRFRRSEGTQVFPPVAKGLPSRDFCGLIRSQFRGLFHSFQ